MFDSDTREFTVQSINIEFVDQHFDALRPPELTAWLAEGSNSQEFRKWMNNQIVRTFCNTHARCFMDGVVLMIPFCPLEICAEKVSLHETSCGGGALLEDVPPMELRLQGIKQLKAPPRRKARKSRKPAPRRRDPSLSTIAETSKYSI